MGKENVNEVDGCLEKKKSHEDSLEYNILFKEDLDLSNYVKDELSILINEESKAENVGKISKRLRLQDEQLKLSEKTRTIGIARCNQMIENYKDQNQSTMYAIIFTVLGFLIDASGAEFLPWFLPLYFSILLILLIIQASNYSKDKKNIYPIYYLKTLLEQTSSDN